MIVRAGSPSYRRDHRHYAVDRERTRRGRPAGDRHRARDARCRRSSRFRTGAADRASALAFPGLLTYAANGVEPGDEFTSVGFVLSVSGVYTSTPTRSNSGQNATLVNSLPGSTPLAA